MLSPTATDIDYIHVHTDTAHTDQFDLFLSLAVLRWPDTTLWLSYTTCGCLVGTKECIVFVDHLPMPRPQPIGHQAELAGLAGAEEELHVSNLGAV